jgi:ribosomal protein S18 acetylase RimI-like enzyme
MESVLCITARSRGVRSVRPALRRRELAGVLLQELANHLVHRLGVCVLSDSAAHNDHGALGIRQLLAEGSGQSLLEGGSIGTEELSRRKSGRGTCGTVDREGL